MTIELNRNDFQKLVDIVRNLPAFRTVDGRIELMLQTLRGSPRANDILSSIKFDGDARNVAVGVLDRLMNFGQVVQGREALGVFVNQVLEYIGEGENAEFLRQLFHDYPLDVPVATGSLLSPWQGPQNYDEIKEKIIGENTLRHIYTLELALESAKAVVHIRTPFQVGTGFLISPNLVVTNNHIIDSVDTALRSEFTFNFQLDIYNKECPIYVVQNRPTGFFYTNSQLDFTITELEETPNIFTPLKLTSSRLQKGEWMAIIQHPGGHYKKFTMHNNYVVYADKQITQYTTSTLPGSSGSPIFNENFEVCAIHHSGGMIVEPTSQQEFLRNEGVNTSAVISDLKQNAPLIYNLIK
jgi:V8-like Glu-specific endopeptidase